MEIHEEMIRIIGEVIGEDVTEKPVNDEKWDWELDSLTFMQMVILIEEEFGVELPDHLLFFEGYETIEKLEAFIAERMEENGAD